MSCQYSVEEGRDVTVALGQSRTTLAPPSHEMSRGSGHIVVMMDPQSVVQPLLESGAGHVKGLSHGFHREPRISGERVGNASLFALDFDRGSLRKSTLRALRPSWLASLRTRSSR